MCLILFAWEAHVNYKLVVAANRDEFYERPTFPLHKWKGNETVIAGKDIKAGGTWMGVNENGRFTALTNYRDPHQIRNDAPSRGELTSAFLLENDSPKEFYEKFSNKSHQYNGFNLLTGTLQELTYFNNEHNELTILSPGVYGLSNAFLDSRWPKVDKAKSIFKKILQSTNPEDDELMAMLYNKELAPDDQLPDTGVPYAWEKLLSAIFIESEKYGTCCSTVLKVDYQGNGHITEQSYPVGNRIHQRISFKFKWN